MLICRDCNGNELDIHTIYDEYIEINYNGYYINIYKFCNQTGYAYELIESDPIKAKDWHYENHDTVPFGMKTLEKAIYHVAPYLIYGVNDPIFNPPDFETDEEEKKYYDKLYKRRDLGCSIHYDIRISKQYKLIIISHYLINNFGYVETDSNKIHIIEYINLLKRKENGTNKIQSRKSLHTAWAKMVKYRDNFRCVECGNDHKIQAHHIKSFKNNKDLRYDINNGITLCYNCHQKKHKQR